MDTRAEGDNVLDLNPYPQAIAELVAYFQELDGAIGIRSSGFEGGGRTVFDSASSWALQATLRTPAHRRAIQQRTMIGYTLGELTPAQQRVLELGCSARRYDWKDVRIRSKVGKEDSGPGAYEHRLRTAFQFGRIISDERSYGVCLLALALSSPVLKAAFLASPEGQAPPPGEEGSEMCGHPRLETGDRQLMVSREYTWPTPMTLFRFLQTTATKRVIEDAKRAAGAVFLASIRAYDAVMQKRNIAMSQERRERALVRVKLLQGGRNAAAL